MWPVQTLTLLLCLTDEEQLFAQAIPTIDEATRTEEVIATEKKETVPADTLVLDFA